jgi:hypothetical protein
MRRARTLVVIPVALMVAAGAGAASVDFGGSFFNLTGAGNSAGVTSPPGSAAKLVQEDVVKAWLQAAMNDNLTVNVQVGGTFDTAPLMPIGKSLLYGDVDLLNLQGNFPVHSDILTLAGFTFGRLLVSDFTGLLVAHRMDGVYVDLEFPVLSVNLSAGYTGLLIKGSSTIELSQSDINDYSNASVLFASPRLIELVQAALLTIPGQKLFLSVIMQQDLRRTPLDLAGGGATPLVTVGSTTYVPGHGGPVNTQYFGLGMSGSILGKAYYDVFSYLQTGQLLAYSGGSYENTFFLAALAGAGIRAFFPAFYSSAAAAKVLFASGDPNSTTVTEGAGQGFSVFSPISRSMIDNVFTPQLSNLVVAEASFSVKPLSRQTSGLELQTSLQADVFFRPTSGAISELGIPAGNTSPYLGTETDVAVNFSPSTDVGSSLWAGLFIPGSAFGSGAALQFKTGLELSLRF